MSLKLRPDVCRSIINSLNVPLIEQLVPIKLQNQRLQRLQNK